MKHIVYITINLANNKFYVGVHKTENPEVFDGYIGCGVNIMKSHTYKKSKTPFQHAVNKYGVKYFKRFTLKVFDNAEDAYKLEEIIVTEDFINSPLTYNVALGGVNPPNTSKVVYQYDLDGNFIKEWDSIILAEKTLNCGNNISSATINKTTSMNSLWADYFVNKLDISDYTITSNKQDVYVYDYLGVFKEKFESITQAAKELNTTTSNIQRAIKGKYKIQGNFISLELVDKFEESEKITLRNNNIHQYSLSGEYIKSYDDITALKQEFGNNASSGVLTSIRLGRAYKNFQWSISKVDRMKELVPDRPKKRRIGRFDLDDNLLEAYETITACSKIYGQSVNKCLRGQKENLKGFKFKYLD